MKIPEVSEANQHYLSGWSRIASGSSGPEIELRALEQHSKANVVLRLRYRLGPAEWTSEGHVETVIAAHAAIREQLVLDRIRLGVRALVRRPG